MKDIVIVPTFSRPEMLWFCLERLFACPETLGLDVKVYVDAHANVVLPDSTKDLQRVQTMFPNAQFNWRQPHKHDGNTFNVMMAYKEAYEAGAKFIFLVEDDVIVDEEFFAWHAAAQLKFPFCSVASRCLKGGAVQDDYVVSSSYASIGVCWYRDSLATVVEHATPFYFRNMSGYLNTVFRDGRADQYTEQDGLIERIIQHNRAQVIFPQQPHCSHIGWYGYHRWNCPRPTGTLEQRYRAVRDAATNPDILKNLAKHVNDVEPVCL